MFMHLIKRNKSYYALNQSFIEDMNFKTKLHYYILKNAWNHLNHTRQVISNHLNKISLKFKIESLRNLEQIYKNILNS